MKVLIAAMVGMLSTPALAHDWYPIDCCSGHDCFPIEESDLTPIPDGFVVNASHTAITGSNVRRSEDGRYHLCTKTGKPDGPPVCVFRPDRGY